MSDSFDIFQLQTLTHTNAFLHGDYFYTVKTKLRALKMIKRKILEL